jgi:hypothetical protein
MIQQKHKQEQQPLQQLFDNNITHLPVDFLHLRFGNNETCSAANKKQNNAMEFMEWKSADFCRKKRGLSSSFVLVIHQSSAATTTTHNRKALLLVFNFSRQTAVQHCNLT